PSWESRNDFLAKTFGDPTNRTRGKWMEKLLRSGRHSDHLLDLSGQEKYAFLLAVDTGEGDSSQYAIVPGLLAASTVTQVLYIASGVIYPSGAAADSLNKFFRAYSRYPGPIYGIPGNHDWYDNLEGFMLHFCGTRSDLAVQDVVGPWRGPAEWLRKRL